MELLSQLAHSLNCSEHDLTNALKTAPLKYKVYKIPKRTFGLRTIAQPTPTLKAIQRQFIQLQSFPMHSVAMAYRSGFSIKENAQVHKNNFYLLKLDLQNFFNSITPEVFWSEWYQFFTEPADQEKELITRLLFWSPSRRLGKSLILSIGAPSSPTVSNFIMYRFDEALNNICQQQGISYTRYADDLTFSTQKKGSLFHLPKEVSKLLMVYYGEKILLNRSKTIFSSKAHNRHITGITVTNNAQLSIGRQKKRYIKHLVHQFSLQQLDEAKVFYLQGMLAHIQHIEPRFIQSLELKYGKEPIKNALM